MTTHEECVASYEAAIRDYRERAVTGEDRLRTRIAELEAEVASLRALHLAACERIAGQSELLSKRAER